MALPTPISQENLQVRMTDGTFKTVCPIPVGGIFLSTESTSPSDIYGGTWSPITGDACLMASNSVGNKGSKNITIKQMPKHTHRIGWYNTAGNLNIDHPVDVTHKGNYRGYNGVKTFEEGNGEPYLPYSYSCYVWKRTN